MSSLKLCHQTDSCSSTLIKIPQEQQSTKIILYQTYKIKKKGIRKELSVSTCTDGGKDNFWVMGAWIGRNWKELISLAFKGDGTCKQIPLPLFAFTFAFYSVYYLIRHITYITPIIFEFEKVEQLIGIGVTRPAKCIFFKNIK